MRDPSVVRRPPRYSPTVSAAATREPATMNASPSQQQQQYQQQQQFKKKTTTNKERLTLLTRAGRSRQPGDAPTPTPADVRDEVEAILHFAERYDGDFDLLSDDAAPTVGHVFSSPSYTTATSGDDRANDDDARDDSGREHDHHHHHVMDVGFSDRFGALVEVNDDFDPYYHRNRMRRTSRSGRHDPPEVGDDDVDSLGRSTDTSRDDPSTIGTVVFELGTGEVELSTEGITEVFVVDSECHVTSPGRIGGGETLAVDDRTDRAIAEQHVVAVVSDNNHHPQPSLQAGRNSSQTQQTTQVVIPTVVTVNSGIRSFQGSKPLRSNSKSHSSYSSHEGDNSEVDPILGPTPTPQVEHVLSGGAKMEQRPTSRLSSAGSMPSQKASFEEFKLDPPSLSSKLQEASNSGRSPSTNLVRQVLSAEFAGNAVATLMRRSSNSQRNNNTKKQKLALPAPNHTKTGSRPSSRSASPYQQQQRDRSQSPWQLSTSSRSKTKDKDDNPLQSEMERSTPTVELSTTSPATKQTLSNRRQDSPPPPPVLKRSHSNGNASQDLRQSISHEYSTATHGCRGAVDNQQQSDRSHRERRAATRSPSLLLRLDIKESDSNFSSVGDEKMKKTKNGFLAREYTQALSTRSAPACTSKMDIFEIIDAESLIQTSESQYDDYRGLRSIHSQSAPTTPTGMTHSTFKMPQVEVIDLEGFMLDEQSPFHVEEDRKTRPLYSQSAPTTPVGRMTYNALYLAFHQLDFDDDERATSSARKDVIYLEDDDAHQVIQIGSDMEREAELVFRIQDQTNTVGHQEANSVSSFKHQIADSKGSAGTSSQRGESSMFMMSPTSGVIPRYFIFDHAIEESIIQVHDDADTAFQVLVGLRSVNLDTDTVGDTSTGMRKDTQSQDEIIRIDDESNFEFESSNRLPIAAGEERAPHSLPYVDKVDSEWRDVDKETRKATPDEIIHIDYESENETTSNAILPNAQDIIRIDSSDEVRHSLAGNEYHKTKARDSCARSELFIEEEPCKAKTYCPARLEGNSFLGRKNAHTQRPDPLESNKLGSNTDSTLAWKAKIIRLETESANDAMSDDEEVNSIVDVSDDERITPPRRSSHEVGPTIETKIQGVHPTHGDSYDSRPHPINGASGAKESKDNGDSRPLERVNDVSRPQASINQVVLHLEGAPKVEAVVDDDTDSSSNRATYHGVDERRKYSEDPEMVKHVVDLSKHRKIDNSENQNSDPSDVSRDVKTDARSIPRNTTRTDSDAPSPHDLNAQQMFAARSKHRIPREPEGFALSEAREKVDLSNDSANQREISALRTAEPEGTKEVRPGIVREVLGSLDVIVSSLGDTLDQSIILLDEEYRKSEFRLGRSDPEIIHVGADLDESIVELVSADETDGRSQLTDHNTLISASKATLLEGNANSASRETKYRKRIFRINDDFSDVCVVEEASIEGTNDEEVSHTRSDTEVINVDVSFDNLDEDAMALIRRSRKNLLGDGDSDEGSEFPAIFMVEAESDDESEVASPRNETEQNISADPDRHFDNPSIHHSNEAIAVLNITRFGSDELLENPSTTHVESIRTKSHKIRKDENDIIHIHSTSQDFEDIKSQTSRRPDTSMYDGPESGPDEVDDDDSDNSKIDEPYDANVIHLEEESSGHSSASKRSFDDQDAFTPQGHERNCEPISNDIIQLVENGSNHDSDDDANADTSMIVNDDGSNSADDNESNIEVNEYSRYSDHQSLADSRTGDVTLNPSDCNAAVHDAEDDALSESGSATGTAARSGDEVEAEDESGIDTVDDLNVHPVVDVEDSLKTAFFADEQKDDDSERAVWLEKNIQESSSKGEDTTIAAGIDEEAPIAEPALSEGERRSLSPSRMGDALADDLSADSHKDDVDAIEEDDYIAAVSTVATDEKAIEEAFLSVIKYQRGITEERDQSESCDIEQRRSGDDGIVDTDCEEPEGSFVGAKDVGECNLNSTCDESSNVILDMEARSSSVGDDAQCGTSSPDQQRNHEERNEVNMSASDEGTSQADHAEASVGVHVTDEAEAFEEDVDIVMNADIEAESNEKSVDDGEGNQSISQRDCQDDEAEEGGRTLGESNTPLEQVEDDGSGEQESQDDAYGGPIDDQADTIDSRGLAPSDIGHRQAEELSDLDEEEKGYTFENYIAEERVHSIGSRGELSRQPTVSFYRGSMAASLDDSKLDQRAVGVATRAASELEISAPDDEIEEDPCVYVSGSPASTVRRGVGAKTRSPPHSPQRAPRPEVVVRKIDLAVPSPSDNRTPADSHDNSSKLESNGDSSVNAKPNQSHDNSSQSNFGVTTGKNMPAIRRLEPPPDYVMTSLYYPEMDGEEIHKDLASEDSGSDDFKTVGSRDTSYEQSEYKRSLLDAESVGSESEAPQDFYDSFTLPSMLKIFDRTCKWLNHEICRSNEACNPKTSSNGASEKSLGHRKARRSVSPRRDPNRRASKVEGQPSTIRSANDGVGASMMKQLRHSRRIHTSKRGPKTKSSKDPESRIRQEQQKKPTAVARPRTRRTKTTEKKQSGQHNTGAETSTTFKEIQQNQLGLIDEETALEDSSPAKARTIEWPPSPEIPDDRSSTTIPKTNGTRKAEEIVSKRPSHNVKSSNPQTKAMPTKLTIRKSGTSEEEEGSLRPVAVMGVGNSLAETIAAKRNRSAKPGSDPPGEELTSSREMHDSVVDLTPMHETSEGDEGDDDVFIAAIANGAVVDVTPYQEQESFSNDENQDEHQEDPKPIIAANSFKNYSYHDMVVHQTVEELRAVHSTFQDDMNPASSASREVGIYEDSDQADYYADRESMKYEAPSSKSEASSARYYKNLIRPAQYVLVGDDTDSELSHARLNQRNFGAFQAYTPPRHQIFPPRGGPERKLLLRHRRGFRTPSPRVESPAASTASSSSNSETGRPQTRSTGSVTSPIKVNSQTSSDADGGNNTPATATAVAQIPPPPQQQQQYLTTLAPAIHNDSDRFVALDLAERLRQRAANMKRRRKLWEDRMKQMEEVAAAKIASTQQYQETPPLQLQL